MVMFLFLFLFLFLVLVLVLACVGFGGDGGGGGGGGYLGCPLCCFARFLFGVFFRCVVGALRAFLRVT